MEQTAIIELLKAGTAIGILSWVVIYFKGELKREREENKLLNVVIRDMQKEMIQVMQKFTEAIKELTNAHKNGKN